MTGNDLFKRLTLAGLLGWIAVFALVPNVLLMGASFASRNPDGFLSPVFSMASYARLFEPDIGSMLLKSLALAGGATLLCLLAGYPFALIAARAGSRRGSLMLLFVMIPFWTNTLIRTYALITLLKADGVINKTLLFLGVIDTPLSLMYTRGAVFVGLTYALLPFMILPLYGAIARMDPRLPEAARDLGAGPLRVFREVTLPLTMPGIISGCMLVFLPALGMFYIPDVLGGAKSMLLGNFIRDQFLATRDWPMGAAASVSLTAVMGLMLLAYWYSLRRQRRKVGL